MKVINYKVASTILSVIIIGLLIYAGPANAFSLGILIGEKYIKLGESAKLFVSGDIEENELIKVESLSAVLTSNTKNIVCTFYPNGTFISGCEGFIISPYFNVNETYSIPSYGYGYGYGYGYSVFKNGKIGYNLSIDTSIIGAGIYSTKIIMHLENGDSEKEGEQLYVIDVDGLRGCSIRANKGELLINNQETSRNKLSLNIPLQNAVMGSGSLQSQLKNNRITYDFKVVGVIQNTPFDAYILVRGNYRENRGNPKSETTLIYLDKKNSLLSMTGSKINVDEMKVTLMKRCEAEKIKETPRRN